MRTIAAFLGSDRHACDDVFASAEDAVAQNNWDSARRSCASSTIGCVNCCRRWRMRNKSR